MRSMKNLVQGRLSQPAFAVAVVLGVCIGGALTSCSDGTEEAADKAATLAYTNIAENPTGWAQLLTANGWTLASANYKSGGTMISDWNSDIQCRFETDSVRFQNVRICYSLGTSAISVTPTYETANCGTYAYTLSGNVLTIAGERFALTGRNLSDTPLTVVLESERCTLVLNGK